ERDEWNLRCGVRSPGTHSGSHSAVGSKARLGTRALSYSDSIPTLGRVCPSFRWTIPHEIHGRFQPRHGETRPSFGCNRGCRLAPRRRDYLCLPTRKCTCRYRQREAELHWYEASGVGRKEIRIKRYLE